MYDNGTAWILFIPTEHSAKDITILELLPEDIGFMILIVVVATWRALSEI